MKKYIIPETIVVELRMTQMLAESFSIDRSGAEIITDDNEILTNKCKNVWEEEW
ncbi:MAG: hypothetical protein K5672_00385 [Bacteroidaceae bacterium]|nr:hypothetical protein [Bacteroidaceae bacterium]